MSEKKPEEKQVRRLPYQQPYLPYPPYPPPQPPPPPPPQYRPPPPPPQYPQTYQPPPRQVAPANRVIQQARIEELAPSISKIALYLGIPLALIAIVTVITAIVLFPAANSAYVPYASIAFMASLIAIAASLIVAFIVMYQIAMGLDRRFEYIVKSIRQQTTLTQAAAPQSAIPPQYQQPVQERLLSPPPRQVAPARPQQTQQVPAQQAMGAPGPGKEQATEQQPSEEEEGINEE